MKTIGLASLVWQWEQIENRALSELREVFKSGNYVSGERVKAFENSFQSATSSDFCVGVNSGTSALHLSLASQRFNPGDEVIVPSNTFIASVAAIILGGGKPVLVDVNSNGLLNMSTFLEAISSRTRGVMPVHLYGSCVDERIILEAKRLGLFVVEDASQSHLATFESGSPIGAFSDYATYSFYPGKNLGALGEAGAVTTSNEELAIFAKKFRNWGSTEKYKHDIFGLNYRMDEIQAVVLKAKLEFLSAWTSERIEIAKTYNLAIEQNPRVRLVNSLLGQPVFHLFVIEVENRELVSEYFSERGIETAIHYPTPLHKHAFLDGHVKVVGSMEISEKLSSRILSIPLYAGMQPSDRERVFEALLKCP